MKKLMLIFAAIMVTLSACQGATRAYQAAEGVDQNAKVVAEHYYALVREANRLKKSGMLSGGDLVKAQQLVRDTRPTIDTLAGAALLYEGTQTAATEAALNQAITAAAIAISSLIDILKAARDSSSNAKPPEDIPDWPESEPLKKAA